VGPSARTLGNIVSWGEEPTPDASGGDGAGWGQEPPRNQLRPLNLGDVLDGTFRLLRDHWRAFFLGLGVVVVPLALLTGLVTTLLGGPQPGFIEMLQNPEVMQTWALEAETPPNIGGLIAASGVAVLASLVLTPLGYGTAVHIAASGYRGSRVDPMASLRAAARRYFGLLGATILLGLVPLLIFLAPMVLVIAGSAAAVDALAIIGGIGFLVSVVFAIIALVRVMLTIPALMIEQSGPVQAVKRSNALVKGKTGLALGTMLVVYIITVIIGLVLALPFDALGGAIGEGAGAVATTIGQMVTTLVTDALVGAALVLIYFDRRVRKEGYDLTELANELGEPPDRP